MRERREELEQPLLPIRHRLEGRGIANDDFGGRRSIEPRGRVRIGDPRLFGETVEVDHRLRRRACAWCMSALKRSRATPWSASFFQPPMWITCEPGGSLNDLPCSRAASRR